LAIPHFVVGDSARRDFVLILCRRRERPAFLPDIYLGRDYRDFCLAYCVDTALAFTPLLALGEKMSEAKYDAIAQDYHRFAKEAFHNPLTVNGLAIQSLITQAREVQGRSLCDLGCGDGHLANYFSEAGATVLGLDISEALLLIASKQFPKTAFKQEDAQKLSSIADSRFDILVSNFALMDIPDLQAVYQSVYRVLKRGGRFIFTITHPCFQSPHSETLHEEGKFLGRAIRQYQQEGSWKSSNSQGIRGRVGAYHRQLSTYLNGLIQTGFSLVHFAEPLLPAAAYESPHMQEMLEIPSIFLIEAQKAQG
jgi:ubiquinone/menaquinone biosynthesis C-methylase UbiE